MKAIRVEQFGGPEVLQQAEVPAPVPVAGQVLVRVHAVGVNPVETYIRSGSYARKPNLPYTPGTDAAGLVESVGPGVTEWKPGDRVYTSGSVTGVYAEFAVCEAAHVHALPANVSFPQGAAVGIPYATAYRALFQRGGARAGERLLVHGASGGVGTAAVQLGRAHGLRVFGTAGTEAGRAHARAQGAEAVFDHRAPDYLQQISTAAAPGIDLVLEMLANVNLGNDLKLLVPGGRVVVIGSRGRVEIDPRDMMGRDADVRGMILFNTSLADLAGIHAALHAGLENGTLRPVVGRDFKLAEAPEAHRAVMDSASLGKIVLVVRDA